MSFELLTDILVATVPLLVIFPSLFALTTWVERKALARIQNRIGPNKVGIPCTRISLFGLGQPVADGIKMLFKEDIVPAGADRLFHLLYDGTVMDTTTHVVIGGEADVIRERLEASWSDGDELDAAVAVAVQALAGPDRALVPDDLEVAVLARENGRRAFRRIEGEALASLLG